MNDEIVTGTIHSENVHNWRDESEPVYSVNLEDEIHQLYPIFPSYHVFQAIGYEAHENKSGNIILTNSPYYTFGERVDGFKTFARMVALDISNQKCYCFGPEFFDRFNIPYDIYDVETGKLVHKNRWVKLEVRKD